MQQMGGNPMTESACRMDCCESMTRIRSGNIYHQAGISRNDVGRMFSRHLEPLRMMHEAKTGRVFERSSSGPKVSLKSPRGYPSVSHSSH